MTTIGAELGILVGMGMIFIVIALVMEALEEYWMNKEDEYVFI